MQRCSAVPMLDWHNPIYGSPFNLFAFNLWTFPIDSYVQIVSKFGLSCCSFSGILTLVDFMQINVHPRSFWLDGLSRPLDSLVLDIQLTFSDPLGVHMHFMPKSIYFFKPALLRIMPVCDFHWHSKYSIWISTFVLLHCVWFPGISCDHKLL